MREIIFLQIGQCGNSVGGKFWEFISDEHGLDHSGHYRETNYLPLQRINVYYNEADHHYVPRVIAADLDQSSGLELRASACGQLISPNSIVSSRNGTGNNFAKGFYTEGAELMDEVLEKLRIEAENCDFLQGFQMVHSIGGGTGSGMGCLLMNNLRDEFQDRIICTNTIIPSKKVSEVVVEPYNAILSSKFLIDLTDETFCMDNEALFNIGTQSLKITRPQYPDLNHMIAYVMSGITASFRYPGQLNTDLRKLSVNMVPFPRLHFFVPGFAPLKSIIESRYAATTISSLVQQMFDQKNMMAACDPGRGKYFTVASLFRGLVSTREVEMTLSDLQQKSQFNFVEWIPNNIKCSICDIPPRGFKTTATFIGNTTSIHSVFGRVVNDFGKMLRRRAFLHWYTGEGMDEQEFYEAEECVNSLISEYKMYENDVKVDDDSD